MTSVPPHGVNRDTTIGETRRWVEQFIVGYQICPFAKRELDRGTIHYSVAESADLALCLEAVAAECGLLDHEPEFETTLLIFPNGYRAFDDYLQLVAMAEALLTQLDYQGIYQLATFHPEYCFEGESESDPANYTNRSPLPMLHFIREQSLEKALQFVEDPAAIPQRNIALTREMGIHKLKTILAACKG